LPRLEEVAAEVGLCPWDFWRFTAAEFEVRVRAYDRRNEAEWRRVAWQTAYLLNIHLREEDRVTVDDLLGRQEALKEQTVEEQVEIMKAWVAALGGSREV
jgi:hypothetical protein